MVKHYVYNEFGSIVVTDDDNDGVLSFFKQRQEDGSDSSEWKNIKNEVESGKIIIDPYIESKPIPTQAEQLDTLAAESRTALVQAKTLDDVKAVVSGLIDGMESIYGTGN